MFNFGKKSKAAIEFEKRLEELYEQEMEQQAIDFANKALLQEWIDDALEAIDQSNRKMFKKDFAELV